MKLSTKSRYGVRALLDVAMHQSDAPVQLKDVARRQQISLSYLEHLVAPLVAAGILKSIRGARGGVVLASPADEIALIDVVRALEGSMAPVECVDDPAKCPRAERCVTRDIWSETKKAMESVLESITLADLVRRQHDKDGAGKIDSEANGSGFCI
ncbi:MAG: Rrf2 family transcriptional regulator [Dehalococcoidia bacterium]|jgi:Rrf2 family protein